MVLFEVFESPCSCWSNSVASLLPQLEQNKCFSAAKRPHFEQNMAAVDTISRKGKKGRENRQSSLFASIWYQNNFRHPHIKFIYCAVSFIYCVVTFIYCVDIYFFALWLLFFAYFLRSDFYFLCWLLFCCWPLWATVYTVVQPERNIPFLLKKLTDLIVEAVCNRLIQIIFSTIAWEQLKTS